jgi:sugar-specific transcriptional regulator TrmB
MIEEGLKQFGMGKNQVKVILFLLDQLEKKYTAKEISHYTEIPLSRIYTILNQLSKWGLIEKCIGTTSKYTITDPENRFNKFFSAQKAKLHHFEKEFYDSFQKINNKEAYVPLLNMDDIFKGAYNIIKDAKFIKSFSTRTSYLTTPEWNKWSLELGKEMFKKAKEGLPIQCIRNNNNFDNVKKITKKNKKDIFEMMSCKNTNFKYLDIPYMMPFLVTDKSVLFGFKDVSKKPSGGVIIHSPEMAEFMSDVFDNIFNKGHDLTPEIINKQMLA